MKISEKVDKKIKNLRESRVGRYIAATRLCRALVAKIVKEPKSNSEPTKADKNRDSGFRSGDLDSPLVTGREKKKPPLAPILSKGDLKHAVAVGLAVVVVAVFAKEKEEYSRQSVRAKIGTVFSHRKPYCYDVAPVLHNQYEKEDRDLVDQNSLRDPFRETEEWAVVVGGRYRRYLAHQREWFRRCTEAERQDSSLTPESPFRLHDVVLATIRDVGIARLAEAENPVALISNLVAARHDFVVDTYLRQSNRNKEDFIRAVFREVVNSGGQFVLSNYGRDALDPPNVRDTMRLADRLGYRFFAVSGSGDGDSGRFLLPGDLAYFAPYRAADVLRARVRRSPDIEDVAQAVAIALNYTDVRALMSPAYPSSANSYPFLGRADRNFMRRNMLGAVGFARDSGVDNNDWPRCCNVQIQSRSCVCRVSTSDHQWRDARDFFAQAR